MKKLVLAIALCSLTLIQAQTVSTFEEFNLAVDSSLNGSDLQGGYQNGNLFFPNTYDTQFGSWYGCSISSETDVSTPGFMNDLSCIAGEGTLNSTTYAVLYMSYLTNNVVVDLTGAAQGGAMEGVYVNNSTYAYLSMRDGDAVAKKFGGVSGNDPDFFLLTIEKYENGTLGSEKIEFYLADYRSSNNTEDYIIDDWTYVDLSSLGNMDSLVFTLSSSDNGQFGMNTPAYFCVDNVTTKDGLATSIFSRNEKLNISIFPNPTSDQLFIENSDNLEGQLQLVDGIGRTLQEFELSNTAKIDVSNLTLGVYYFNVILNDGSHQSLTFIKN